MLLSSHQNPPLHGAEDSEEVELFQQQDPACSQEPSGTKWSLNTKEKPVWE